MAHLSVAELQQLLQFKLGQVVSIGPSNAAEYSEPQIPVQESHSLTLKRKKGRLEKETIVNYQNMVDASLPKAQIRLADSQKLTLLATFATTFVRKSENPEDLVAVTLLENFFKSPSGDRGIFLQIGNVVTLGTEIMEITMEKIKKHITNHLALGRPYKGSSDEDYPDLGRVRMWSGVCINLDMPEIRRKLNKFYFLFNAMAAPIGHIGTPPPLDIESVITAITSWAAANDTLIQYQLERMGSKKDERLSKATAGAKKRKIPIVSIKE